MLGNWMRTLYDDEVAYVGEVSIQGLAKVWLAPIPDCIDSMKLVLSIK